MSTRNRAAGGREPGAGPAGPMWDRRQVVRGGAALGLAGAGLMGAPAAGRPAGPAGAAAQSGDITGMLTVSQDQREAWIRNFNPLVAGGTSLWPSTNGIYEPLMIYSLITGQMTPWLATDYAYAPDGLALTLTIREGVSWSDGQPFSAGDVAYTFNLLKANPGLSGAGAIRNILDISSEIVAPDPVTVRFTFTEVYSPGLYDIVAQNIVPEHVWSTVEDPVTFLNEEPVATGPFTEIPIFESNYWELRRNPTYWQADRVGIEGIRFPVINNNDTGLRLLVGGEVDWSSNFIPDVEGVFVAEDPDNHGYWFPSTGATVHLYLNTAAEGTPFADPAVLKAVSMALDREEIVELAIFDYAAPADSTGLSDAYPAWKDAAYAGEAWVRRDVDAANAALDAAGLTRDGDVRTYGGQPMEYELLVVNGWSDWVQSCQLMAEHLAEIGIRATVTPLDLTVWQGRVQEGDFTMSIGWSNGGATPFGFYRGMMSSQTRNPVGTRSDQNWHRFASPEADALLDQFAATSDEAEQKRLASELQRVYAEQAPAIPLFPSPQYFEYNRSRFENWPTAENPYAVPGTGSDERLLVLTSLRARQAT